MAVLFADDTNLFITGKNLHQITEIMNTELIKLSLWLQVNRVSLNVEKTNYIIFSSKRRLKNAITITIDNKLLKEVQSTKLLGVQIDPHFTWTEHLSIISTEMAKGIGIINISFISIQVFCHPPFSSIIMHDIINVCKLNLQLMRHSSLHIQGESMFL